MTRVLLLDDDVDTREILSIVLEEQGFTVDTAATAREALVQLRAHHYDCAIFDIHLEESMSGLDLARAVVRRAPPPLPPLVLISGYALDVVHEMLDFEPEVAKLMFRGKPPIVLTKPPRTADLVDAVRRATS